MGGPCVVLLKQWFAGGEKGVGVRFEGRRGGRLDKQVKKNGAQPKSLDSPDNSVSAARGSQVQTKIPSPLLHIKGRKWEGRERVNDETQRTRLLQKIGAKEYSSRNFTV